MRDGAGKERFANDSNGRPTQGMLHEAWDVETDRTFGDGPAEESSVGRIDFISLTCLVSSVLLLTGLALSLPGQSIELTSICRSPVDPAAARPTALPGTPVVARVKARPES